MKEEAFTIPGLFKAAVSESPSQVALQIEKQGRWQRFTYRDLEQRALKVAAFLLKAGLKKGDFVALVLENGPEWPAIYLGITSAGLSCVPLDPRLSHEELENLIRDSGAKLVFSSRKLPNSVDFSRVDSVSADNLALPEVSPEDTASLIYTSGTTALPKGVLLSHRNICANFQSIRELKICFSTDNFLSILPLQHTYPFMVTLIVPLFLGARITYCPSLNPEELSRTVKEGKATILVAVPQLFSLLQRAITEKINKLPSLLSLFLRPIIRMRVRRYFGKDLRLMVSGGARLDPQVGRDLSGLGFKLIEGYGLTETSPIVTLNPLRKIKFASVGKPIPGVEIKIFNPDQSGIGEVLIKGANVMQGYFKQPGLTAEAIKEGWLYSGDLGYLDKEGYLFLVGREKEILVLSSGKNIYPEELEEYYLQAPSIKEICIISRPEKSFGSVKEALYAVIVPELEFFRQKKETNIYEKVRWDLETLARKLPGYQHVMGFTLTKEELPRTILKKIKRYQVREQYAKESIQEPPAQEQVSGIAGEIVSYISKEVNRPVYLDSHLEIDLGIDSLGRVNLALGLEALLKIKIPDNYLYQTATVKELINSIAQLMQKPAFANGEAQKSWADLLRMLPPEAVLEKIRIEARLIDRLITRVLKKIFLSFFRTFWFLKIEGTQNLPLQGPYLVCPNHASYLDGLVVFASLPYRNTVNTFFLGYYAIFGSPLLKWVNKLGHLLSIDTSTHLTEALQAVSFVLSQDKIVCLFPEGMRSIDGEIKEFKKGVGILIKELDIPVVPVYIKGTYRAWPRSVALPRPYPVKIVFGRPLTRAELLKEGKRDSSGDDYRQIAEALKQEVAKLAC
ncbi:MAG: AMP-binding protein [Candidatus Omnitrophota bacterium]|jgi:long-chain acyl-CoA synthetase